MKKTTNINPWTSASKPEGQKLTKTAKITLDKSKPVNKVNE